MSIFESMKTKLILVGKTTDQQLEKLITDYAQRLTHYLSFEITTLPELKNTKALTPDQQKEKEAALILKQLAEGDHIALLDEGGKEYRSVQFAQYIEKLQHTGARRLVFIVGGPYGFASAIYERAKEKLSLSKMTFSHQMIRLLFVEQMYRAMTILRGEPYHHE